jgi:hypothetical protein
VRRNSAGTSRRARPASRSTGSTSSCGGDHAPADLKSKLRASIRQTVESRGGVTIERTEVTIEQRTE